VRVALRGSASCHWITGAMCLFEGLISRREKVKVEHMTGIHRESKANHSKTLPTSHTTSPGERIRSESYCSCSKDELTFTSAFSAGIEIFSRANHVIRSCHGCKQLAR